MNKTSLRTALLSACFFSTGSFAGPFDGATTINCNTNEVQDCEAGRACKKQTPEQASISKTLKIDLDKKTVQSVYRNEPLPILASDVTDERIALHGHERWLAWSAVLRQKDSSLTVAIADRKGAFVINGKCQAEKSAPAAATETESEAESPAAGQTQEQAQEEAPAG
jgi:hypothetical protein